MADTNNDNQISPNDIPLGEQVPKNPVVEPNSAAAQEPAAQTKPTAGPLRDGSEEDDAAPKGYGDLRPKANAKTAANPNENVNGLFQGVKTGDSGYIGTVQQNYYYKNMPQDENKAINRLLENTTLDVQPFDSREIDRVARVFVNPISYGEALSVFERECFVILRGAAGMGKQAAALHLATERFGENDVFQSRPVTRFEELKELQMDRRVCFILDNAPFSLFQQINEFRLRELLSKLKKHGCYLIITSSAEGIRLPSSTQLVVSILTERSPTITEEIIKKHIAYFATGESEALRGEALRLFSLPQIQLILTGIETNNELLELAFNLVRTARGELLVDELAGRLSKMSEVERDTWLNGFYEQREWAFLLSMAVFAGARREHIEQTANMLKSIAPQIFDPPLKKDAPPPPNMPISDLYKRSRCHPEYTDTYEKLVFDNERYGFAVLDYFWKEYPFMRDVICQWLTHIGKSGIFTPEATIRMLSGTKGSNTFDNIQATAEQLDKSSNMRIRAAVAVGELARRRNFDYVEENILRLWVQTGQLQCQFMVGLAIASQALNDEALARVVLEKLGEWTERDGRYKRAAALAYGIIALKYPAEAFKSLYHIAEIASEKMRNPFAVFDSVIESLAGIFGYGCDDATYYVLVLQALAHWSHEQVPNRAIPELALYAFARIAVNDVTEKNGEEWLTLLVQAQKNTALRGLISGLMRRSLSSPTIRKFGLQVLRVWCEHAESISTSQRTVYALILLVYERGNPIDRERLLYYMDAWCQQGMAFTCKVSDALRKIQ